ncbi:MAG TPA: hypothetical protein VGG39_25480 [Polyangiaceae bacterium]|jgi:hypothetical protein
MRTVLLALLVCSGVGGAFAACSSGSSGTTGAVSGGNDAGSAAETAAGGGDDAGSPPEDSGGGISDAGAADGDAQCVLVVDDAGVTHGCHAGGQGPGDQDDGGGAAAPPPPSVSPDASDLPLGSPCWDNAQCVSTICFDYAVRGTFCTQRCWTAADCPPPLDGCNGMGVCRMGDGGN